MCELHVKWSYEVDTERQIRASKMFTFVNKLCNQHLGSSVSRGKWLICIDKVPVVIKRDHLLKVREKRNKCQ